MKPAIDWKLFYKVFAPLPPSNVDNKSVEVLLNEIEQSGLSYTVENGRVRLLGGDKITRDRYAAVILENEALEVQMILSLAVKDSALLDEIEERACMRFVDGYSDSLYATVLCNIRPLKEKRDARELSERERIDWEKELEKFRKV